MRKMRIPLLLLGFGLVVIIGCDGPGNTVSGKVTYKGDPVSGSITFSGKGKDVTQPIKNDGTYTVEKLAAGVNTITIKGMPGAGAVPKDETPAGKKKDELKLEVTGAAPTKPGVAPPKKYETAATSPLTLDVKSGKNPAHDIELEP